MDIEPYMKGNELGLADDWWVNLLNSFPGFTEIFSVLVITIIILDIVLLFIFHHKIKGLHELFVWAIINWNEQNGEKTLINRTWWRVQRIIAYQYFFLFPEKY